MLQQILETEGKAATQTERRRQGCSEQLVLILISRKQLEQINSEQVALQKAPLHYYIKQEGRIYP